MTQLLESKGLMGKGIGFVDLHLLAATQLTANAQLWTRDKGLQQLALSFGFSFLEQRSAHWVASQSYFNATVFN